MTDNSAHSYSEGSECVDCAKEKHELRQEIANHIAVNSLLTDSDGEADLANKLFKAQEEIQQLKEALKEYNEATDYSKTYQMWSPTKELDKAYNKARKLIDLNKPEK